uniref:Large ribosomal subunit protein mL43 n=1 Tax=Bionectria ochroleuca TaxID=29856 RepID=A0A8H7NB29_BIOOC
MTVKALRAIPSGGKNGLGAFILQCKKLEFHYCDWAGSSKGMNGFIKSLLPKFAAANPQVEFSISPDPASTPSLPATTSTAERSQSVYETYHHTKSSRSWSYYGTRAERS